MMKRLLPLLAGVTVAGAAPAQIFQPGNVVVLRAGDPSLTLSSNAAPLFLEEWDPSTNTLVQTIGLPNANNAGLAVPAPIAPNVSIAQRGFSTSEGQLTLSSDGRYLLVGGYAAPVGATNPRNDLASVTPRVVATIDVLTGLIDTSTALTDAYDANDFRGVASDDGVRFWTAGSSPAGAVRFAGLGDTTSLPINGGAPTNVRFVGIHDFDLFITSASTGAGTLGVLAVGTGGLPTTGGQTQTLLPGFPTTGSASPYDFWFADDDTLYVADIRTDVADGGVQKWTRSGGTWTFQYALQVTVGVDSWGARGVSGVRRNGVNELWFTAEDDGFVTHLCRVVDSGPGSAVTVVATEPAQTDYRGVRVVGTQFLGIPAGCGQARLQVSGAGLTGTTVRSEIVGAQAFPVLNYAFTPVGLPLTNCTCTLIAGPEVLVASAVSDLQIPNNPSLVGTMLLQQGIDFLDPQAACSELPFLTLTDGVQFMIR